MSEVNLVKRVRLLPRCPVCQKRMHLTNVNALHCMKVLGGCGYHALPINQRGRTLINRKKSVNPKIYTKNHNMTS